MPDFSRRAVLSGAATSLAAASLAACGEVPVVPGAEPPPAVEGFGGGGFDARFAGLYGPVAGERFPIPAAPLVATINDNEWPDWYPPPQRQPGSGKRLPAMPM